MPKICVIHPKISYESAKELADAMGWDLSNPFAEGRRDYTEYSGVFNYGCNRKIYAHNVINTAKSVAQCIDKVATYKAFKEAGIPTVDFILRKEDIPKAWDIVVVRDKVDGARGEGLEYWYQDPECVAFTGLPCPNGAVFTNYFDHTREYRIMVFLGKLVGCYIKQRTEEGQWEFVEDPNPRLKEMKEAAITAANALKIDFVGFDVLRNKKGQYCFLEANTGCILTEDMIEAIKEYIK